MNNIIYILIIILTGLFIFNYYCKNKYLKIILISIISLMLFLYIFYNIDNLFYTIIKIIYFPTEASYYLTIIFNVYIYFSSSKYLNKYNIYIFSIVNSLYYTTFLIYFYNIKQGVNPSKFIIYSNFLTIINLIIYLYIKLKFLKFNDYIFIRKNNNSYFYLIKNNIKKNEHNNCGDSDEEK